MRKLRLESGELIGPEPAGAFLTWACVSFTVDTNLLYPGQVVCWRTYSPGEKLKCRVGESWPPGELWIHDIFHAQGVATTVSTKSNWEFYPFFPPDSPKACRTDKMALRFPVGLVAETGDFRIFHHCRLWGDKSIPPSSFQFLRSVTIMCKYCTHIYFLVKASLELPIFSSTSVL